MHQSIPRTMRAVQLDALGASLVVRECPVPAPGPGEVLIRMAAAPINPSDLAYLLGSGPRKPFPTIPGIEGSGTVVAASAGLLPRFLVGKRVACASDLYVPSGGTWAEYMSTSARLCVPLRKSMTLEQGAMLLVNPLTVLAIFEIAKRGKHAAIVSTAAASALGRMLIRVGLKVGVPIINIVRRQEQVNLLHSIGARYVLNSSDTDFSTQLRRLTHELKATLVLDALAGEDTQQLVAAAPRGSTVVVYGFLSRRPNVVDPLALILEEKHLTGLFLPNWQGHRGFLQTFRDTSRAQRLVGTDLQTTIQKRLPLSAAQQALDLYRQNMTAGKVLLVANAREVQVDPTSVLP